MAIAFDAASSLSTSAWTSGTSVSWNHTPVGTPTAVIVGVFSVQKVDPTAATYGGVTMTLIGKSNGSSGSGELIWLYYLVNPPTGLQTVSFSWAVSQSNVAAAAVTYTGTATSASLIDSSNVQYSGASLTFVQSTTVVASNCWLVGFFRDSQGSSDTLSTGSLRGGYVAGGVRLWDGNGTTGTGLQSVTVTSSTSSAIWDGVIASIAPPSAAKTNPAFLLNFV